MSGRVQLESLLADSREALLGDFQTDEPIVLFRTFGNVGDRLIHAGARQLLKETPYIEEDMWMASERSGHVAIVCGSGGWCRPYHSMPMYVREIERNFDRVLVWPSSFDVSEPAVAEWLAETKAVVFVREKVSHAVVVAYRPATLALDTAFFFDYRPYVRRGTGTLVACRTDKERKGASLPANNVDISLSCLDIDHWLHTIAAHAVVVTDRAHVMIAAGMLGKTVRYADGVYRKVSAIADFAFHGSPDVSSDGDLDLWLARAPDSPEPSCP